VGSVHYWIGRSQLLSVRGRVDWAASLLDGPRDTLAFAINLSIFSQGLIKGSNSKEM